MNKIYTLSFPEARNIVVSGDIHGDFNLLVYKLCVQYQMKDTVLIVAGDCGFGFEKKEYYEQMARRNAKRMNEANNWIVFVRGNHDNPLYFDGKQFKHKRFIAIPDYSILIACKHTILCVGVEFQLTDVIVWRNGRNIAQRIECVLIQRISLVRTFIGPMKLRFIMMKRSL